jgi:nucleoside phosphorylase
MKRYAERGALAVDMQAASLFAFGQRQECPVALVAHLTNVPDHEGEAFAKGPADRVGSRPHIHAERLPRG